MEETSMRSKGLKFTGKLLKGVSQPLEFKTSTGPIPSKHETILLKTNSFKGFGTSANRFHSASIDKDIPGPGHYDKQNQKFNTSTFSLNSNKSQILNSIIIIF